MSVSSIIVQTKSIFFGKLVDSINSERVCCLEVAWILEDIELICESFIDISFVNVPIHQENIIIIKLNKNKLKNKLFYSLGTKKEFTRVYGQKMNFW